MEKKSNTTGITKSFAKKMESISPFELKNRLIDMADESVKKMLIPCSMPDVVIRTG